MKAMKKTIMLVFGTRPEAIKMCPLVRALQAREAFDVKVCVTGQHRQMLDQVLRAFDVVPDVDLSVMRARQTLFDVTGSILQAMGPVLAEHSPDVVLVHGDTTTTFAAALACFYLRIPVGHVEAGLRTYNLDAPYPEEFNRQAVSVLARYHFCPTERARENLLREGKDAGRLYVTGNTAIDALRTTVRDAYDHEALRWAQGSRLILLTAHRRENLGEPMRGIFRAVRRIVDDFPDVKVLYPVHPNPAVREAADEALSNCEAIRLIEPLDVLDFHNFMKRSFLVLTDSGGIQEEAPSLGKPVLVLRTTTERPEGIASGTLRLVGTDEGAIYAETARLLTDPIAYAAMAQAANPYGDGKASERIAEILASN